ncbi:acetyltransferase [Clostridium sp. MB40-C1]|uniref:acetyltransferase n=1 Tax=Clostridium sp. MB40-C1 TaxID=3070996 RepID=UPI0027DF8C63|nr:acetyltransferase [Clostridium sp. MB40-C1]WMJ81181.1 acetyltransferase [Clostridium sp. MB40-C1]
MEKIVLVGGGGHCKVIIDIIKSMRKYEIVGITDSKGIGDKLLDVPIIGNDDVLSQVYKGGVKNAFISFGSIGNMGLRDKIYYNLKRIGYEVPVLIHNKAVVSPYAKIKEGTCVMAGAVINPGAEIGENCIINTSSVVEHDCLVGRNTHISPRVCLAGGVKVGINSHIGAGASVIQGINIGSDVVVGAGAVVLNDIKDSVTTVGVPAKIIKCR